jgi:hypothetical protein
LISLAASLNINSTRTTLIPPPVDPAHAPTKREVATNYSGISDSAKWILSFSMLLGRLEILTLMALLHKAFWRF